jgi:hypothetical protein
LSRSTGESSDPVEKAALAMELAALGLESERAENFAKGRAAGLETARRNGLVPDHVVAAIAAMMTGDPGVRAAG